MNEALIKELVKKRGHIKSRLTKFSGYIRELAEKALCAAQVTELQLRIAKLECVYNTYDEIQTKLEYMVEDDEAQLDERSDFEDLYYSSVAAAKELVNMHTKVAPSDGGSDNNTRRHPHVKSIVRIYWKPWRWRAPGVARPGRSPPAPALPPRRTRAPPYDG
ncbi:uncharacterized protein LOC134656776 isoform X1 [Cydia amplana]|uniref:uncharacterized protein LOC134656776 isoform X1 n=1 Tax=Cydia amplana TaxID=1869771 RepID=UPI002FE50B70